VAAPTLWRACWPSNFSNTFKQQFFVENRPGAGNMIGIETVARSAGDGYTLLMVPSTLALNSVLYKKVNYDPIGDFSPITVRGHGSECSGRQSVGAGQECA